MNLILIISVTIIVLLLFVLFGLRIQPKSFSQPSFATGETPTIPLPTDLPAPVNRYYQTVYGKQIPVIKSVVITGRGWIRPFKIWLPTRFIFVHEAGKNYRHYFEATFFGFPFLKVNEGIINGESFFESPMGTYSNDPNTNQGANLALWAEGGWFPSIWLTDTRVTWEGLDDNTALLRVPYEKMTETFIVRFDSQNGMINMLEAMRYKTPKDLTKTLWIPSLKFDDKGKSVSYATWLDDGKPWAKLILETIQINPDLREYMRARGS
jgi:hypothetical protein